MTTLNFNFINCFKLCFYIIEIFHRKISIVFKIAILAGFGAAVIFRRLFLDLWFLKSRFKLHQCFKWKRFPNVICKSLKGNRLIGSFLYLTGHITNYLLMCNLKKYVLISEISIHVFKSYNYLNKYCKLDRIEFYSTIASVLLF